MVVFIFLERSHACPGDHDDLSRVHGREKRNGDPACEPSQSMLQVEFQLGGQLFRQPISGRLNPAGSFYDVALHICRQIGKFGCVPCLPAVFAKGLLERVIIGADTLGGMTLSPA